MESFCKAKVTALYFIIVIIFKLKTKVYKQCCTVKGVYSSVASSRQLPKLSLSVCARGNLYVHVFVTVLLFSLFFFGTKVRLMSVCRAGAA